ncbi:BRO1-like domain protein [Necator americanus]|uniref:BRO1-like domain protein n=1 Tax=Necator americanus TaxID=51031 RepID=W2SIV0_NECAM|nr:BRO1-like domain protein [Necator americanus]ETN69584.1 BRO1-like domain protein [Necator americanus]
MSGTQEKSRSRPLLARAFGSKKATTTAGAQISLLTTENNVYQHCFLAVPLKTTNDVDLVKPLTRFLEASNSTVCVKVTDLRGAIEVFNRLRSNACSKTTRDPQLLLACVAEYYDQLTAFEGKLVTLTSPRLEGFRWRDAFESGRSFLSKRKSAYATASVPCQSGWTRLGPTVGYKSHSIEADVSLERAAVLFNYGALLSQIAASQPLHTDEEKKTSAKLFQQSAGVFAQLRDFMKQMTLERCTADLQPDSLTLLSNLMLAQAQESIYTKAYGDKMNQSALVKIAAQTSDFYMEISKTMNMETAKGYWKKDWLSIITGKALAFQAIAQLHQAQVNLQQQEVGERLTRLKYAIEQVQIVKHHLPSGCLHEQIVEIENTYAAALKENQLIYHAQTSDFHTLPVVPRAVLAKALPPSSPLCPDFKDVFSNVIPINILMAVQNHDTMKNERLKREADRLNEETQVMESIVASLGMSDDSSLPELVKRHSAEVKKAGGVKELQNKINEMSSLRARNKEILADIEQTLNKEKLSDADLRRQLGPKSKRLCSDELVGPFLQEVSNFRGSLHTTSEEDKMFKKNFELNRQAIEMLSKNEKDLRLLLPPRPHRMADKAPEATSFLLKLIDKAQEVKCERAELLKDIHEKCNSTSMEDILPLLCRSKNVSPDDILKEKMNEVCETIKEEIDKSLKKQKLLMKDVEKWCARFSNANQQKGPIVRDHVEKSLLAGYDVFHDLSKKLPGRIKRYHHLMENLLRLQQKVNDFSFARETEKEELLRAYRCNPSCNGSETSAAVPNVHPMTQVSFVPSAPPPYSTQPFIYSVPEQQSQFHLPQYTHVVPSGPTAPPLYQPPNSQYSGGPSPWHNMGYPH